MITIEQFDIDSGETKRRDIEIDEALALFSREDWVRYVHTHGEWLLNTVAEMKSSISIDALRASVAKLSTDVAALKGTHADKS